MGGGSISSEFISQYLVWLQCWHGDMWWAGVQTVPSAAKFPETPSQTGPWLNDGHSAPADIPAISMPTACSLMTNSICGIHLDVPHLSAGDYFGKGDALSDTDLKQMCEQRLGEGHIPPHRQAGGSLTDSDWEKNLPLDDPVPPTPRCSYPPPSSQLKAARSAVTPAYCPHPGPLTHPSDRPGQ
ncbi:unnamed protein product [Pleuronectes platessa]|uniref:Uncharacterized protein n=1 Tax=Pleuronectes platessa TaxID=8262 RepID=A0A9N7YVW1_PLEPL|nr:unnamed protein product [Pleuronectes platessa]